MARVNFYDRAPSATQAASDLANNELLVFNHTTSGARIFADQVESLVNFDITTNNENTIPKSLFTIFLPDDEKSRKLVE